MKKIIMLLFVVAIFSGCEDIYEEIVPMSEHTQAESEDAGLRTRSGGGATFDTLPDPYALANMQAIFDSLSPTPVVLQPTDLYVRFLPQDSLQMELLEDFYDLDLFDYPLDLDIPDNEEYVDPTIPEGEIKWQYTTVKLDFVFPEDITYEILRECYIPEDDSIILPSTRNQMPVNVERAAYERLGYVIDDDPQTRSGGGGGQCPEGHVYVRNDADKDVPVVGVRVKVHFLTKSDKIYTNVDGWYKTTKKFWNEKVHYKLIFINYRDFVVRNNAGTRAKYPYGYRSKYGCDMYLYKNTGLTRDVWRWAAINNAAWEYFAMCRQEGITRANGTLKFWYRPNKEWSSAPMLARIIHIGTKNANYRNIYTTVNHELAHTSHYAKAGYDDYWRHYIDYITICWFNGESTYGDGTRNNAGRVAVGEMWGNAIGAIQYCERYNQARLNDVYYNTWHYWYGDRNDFFDRPGDEVVPNERGWIHPDPIWALITQKVLTKKQVFDCLTTDVSQVWKLRDEMCRRYPTKANLIRMAFLHDNVIPTAITGPDNPVLNEAVIYSVLPPLSGDIFNGYTVTGGRNDALSGMTDRNLTIKFLEYGSYTITARFSSPGGSTTYPVLTKEVNVGGILNLVDTVITSDRIVTAAVINIRNVTVKNGAKLTLQAAKVTFDEPFVVESNSSFEIINL